MNKGISGAVISSTRPAITSTGNSSTENATGSMAAAAMAGRYLAKKPSSASTWSTTALASTPEAWPRLQCGPLSTRRSNRARRTWRLIRSAAMAPARSPAQAIQARTSISAAMPRMPPSRSERGACRAMAASSTLASSQAWITSSTPPASGAAPASSRGGRADPARRFNHCDCPREGLRSASAGSCSRLLARPAAMAASSTLASSQAWITSSTPPARRARRQQQGRPRRSRQTLQPLRLPREGLRSASAGSCSRLLARPAADVSRMLTLRRAWRAGHANGPRAVRTTWR